MHRQPPRVRYGDSDDQHSVSANRQPVRIDGVRYVVLVSGNSGRVYIVRADARGCGCIWSQRSITPCSHRIAVELAALEDELAEAPVSLKSLRDLYPPCAAGCGQITEGNAFCDDCSAQRERSARLAAARARVLQEWTA